MRKLSAIILALVSYSSIAAGPSAKQATDISFKFIELEGIPKGDKSGISRAFLDCQYRLSASGGEDKTELAMMNELSDFMTYNDAKPSASRLDRMIAQIEADKALRRSIATADKALLACCETIAAGGKPNDSAIRKAVKDRKSAISKRAELWSPACRKTCSKQTSGM